MEINPDIIRYLALTRLEYPQIINLCKTNSRYNAWLCQNPYFMRDLYRRDFGEDPPGNPILSYRSKYLDLLIRKVIQNRDADRFTRLLSSGFDFYPYLDEILSIGDKYNLILRNRLALPNSQELGRAVQTNKRPYVFTNAEYPFLQFLLKYLEYPPLEYLGDYYIVPLGSRYRKVSLKSLDGWEVPILTNL